MIESKENPLRVKLEGPEYFRKDILESAESAVLNLKRFENFKVLREVKHDLTDKLVKILRNIHKDVNKVKRDMPSIAVSYGNKEGFINKDVISGIDGELEEIKNRLKKLKV